MSLWQLQQDGPQPSTSNPTHAAALAINEAHTAAIDKVRANNALSPAGKAAALAPHYLRARADMAKLQEQTAAATAKHVQSLHKAAFGAPTGAVEGMSYRDALGRADAIDDPAMAAHLMERAQRGGDALMARALGQRAADMGWSVVLAKYVDANPAAGAALTELAARSAGAMMQQLADAAHFHVAKPSELAGLQDHEIESYVAKNGA